MALKKIPRKQHNLPSCGSYTFETKIVHRDNKDCPNYRGGGSGSGYRTRIPSIKRPVSTWKRFYDLFPYILKRLKQGDFYKNQIETDGIIIVQETRTHGGYTRSKTLKFKKIW